MSSVRVLLAGGASSLCEGAEMLSKGRFAPSTTGAAHPGTLLAALLCWLDARAGGAEVELRFEDLDPQRCRPEYEDAIRRDLEWLGLDWDRSLRQSERVSAYDAVLDRLALEGCLYPCRCSRADIRAVGERAPDGGWRYPGTCRDRSLPSPATGGWRACQESIRLRLPPGRVELADLAGLDLSQDPFVALGDPVLRRRDGAVAYHLACVVDDAASGVTRIVRGRDIAVSTATQIVLQQLLGYATPSYRHHLLLMEESGDKLAKLHAAVGGEELRLHYSGEALCGVLAHVAGLLPEPAEVTPVELVETFRWDRVVSQDRVLRWTGRALMVLPAC